MVLNYSNWKAIYEVANSTDDLYVTCDLTEKMKTYGKHNDDVVDFITSQITSLFPNASVERSDTSIFYRGGPIKSGFELISIPQDKFEDLDGKTEPLLFDLPSRFDYSDVDSYPEIILDWFKNNAKENFSKGDKKIKCILKDEFSNYSREELIAKIEKDLFEKFGMSNEDIEDQIENMMLSKSLGEIGGKVSTLNKELVKKIGQSFLVKDAIDKLKPSNLQVTQINVGNIEAQVATKIEKLLIDYSKLSEEQLDAVLAEVLSALEYLGTTLLNFGKDATKIARKYSDILLDHLDNYPELLEKLYELKNKK